MSVFDDESTVYSTITSKKRGANITSAQHFHMVNYLSSNPQAVMVLNGNATGLFDFIIFMFFKQL